MPHGQHARTCCRQRPVQEITVAHVLDLSRLDLEEIATALANQTDYEHRWLINPQTGEVVFWTSDTGIDGQGGVNPRATRRMPTPQACCL